MNYEPKPTRFNIPKLEGISEKSIEEHIGLYEGYVKNFNAIGAKIEEYLKDSAQHSIALSELTRRHSFEFGGMRLHELYFSQFEGGAAPVVADGPFAAAITRDYGSVENLVKEAKQVGLMRGPGWSLLYWDAVGQTFHLGFSGEQHQGHFVTLPVILALDVWEHAFLLDYGAQGKGKYIDAFFKNLNWGSVEKRFAEATK